VAIVARATISAAVVISIVIRSAIAGAAIMSAVVRLRVVGRAEVIEQKRERERNTETHTLAPSWELGQNQGANREQKNQQLIHRTFNLRGDYFEFIINRMKREAQSEAL